MTLRTLNAVKWRQLCLLCAAGLLACLALALPTTAWAQVEPQNEEGCGCHSAETEAWEQSPHGQPGVDGLPAATCEGCHGPYVRSHPDDGVMALSVDSDTCVACHADTANQWQGSMHAAAGVQCIGCHLSHSQTLRLSDETLCLSCHRDDVESGFHLAHRLGDVACTDCHLSPPDEASVAKTMSGATVVTIAAPNHDFAAISGDKCVDCHAQRLDGDQAINSSVKMLVSSDGANPDGVNAANTAPQLTAKLKTVESEKRSLVATSVMALGLGIGIGGVMGMILVLAAGYITQKRSST